MRTGHRALFLASLSASVVAFAPGQEQTQLKRRIDIVLEKKGADSVAVMDPTHVFSDNDLIRFRLATSLAGFLYVINEGSSGKFEQLFPKDELREGGHVALGKKYLIPPSGSGWFKITGPPGYETVYFVISPTDLGKSLLKTPPEDEDVHPNDSAGSGAFASATPRCNDELFRTRGECLDSNAGAKLIPKGESLPEQLPDIPITTARDLIFVKDSKDTLVFSTQPFTEPAIYRFKIAHK